MLKCAEMTYFLEADPTKLIALGIRIWETDDSVVPVRVLIINTTA